MSDGTQVYSHRNGETTWPSVNGDYWLEYPVDEGQARVFEIDTWCDFTWYRNGQTLFEEVRVYGPIPQPNATPSPVGASVKLICDKCNDYLEHPAYCETCYDTAVNAWREAEAALEKRGASVPSEVVEVLKLVYRKHHMGDPSIGWDELSDAVLNSLSNAMGVEELVKWQEAREDASNG